MTDSAAYRRPAHLPGLVLGQARFATTHFDRHFHLDTHIGVVTEGVQRQSFRRTVSHLAPGGISLMPPGEVHDGTRHDDRPFTLLTYRISPAGLTELAEDLTETARPLPLAAVTVDQPDLHRRLIRLHSLLMADSPGLMPGLMPGLATDLATESEWLAVLAALLRHSHALPTPPPCGPLGARRLRRVQEYCHDRLADKITLEDLAAVCGLGRVQFLRQFRASVGMTPYAWLLRLRLELACARLRDGRQTIAAVAQDSGFHDQSHFNRAFRRAYGVAPSAY